MRWNLEENFASPATGTFFSLLSRTNGSKIILWYSGSRLLNENDSIYSNKNNSFVINQTLDLKILHIFPYHQMLWKNMKSNCLCPMNTHRVTNLCCKKIMCQFEQCPFEIDENINNTNTKLD